MLTGSSLYSQKEIPDSTLRKIDNCFQKRGEIYFKFKVFQLRELEFITRIISIANVDGNDVYAFANKDEFTRFRKLGYKIEYLPHPSEEEGKHIKMAESIEQILGTWDVYPTYSQYETMMDNFAATYPSLCKIVNAGNSVNGRKILFAVLSKNVNTTEAEPKFMYTSTMHGNETAGYVFMLRLIDTLLKSYSSNQLFSYLLDNMEIWINPLANPDGTYAGGNNTVSGATRENANGIDLNRNFPDPLMGDHPDGYAWQPETIIFMNVATQNYFTMSANFHSGVEVVNYPWDYKLTPVTADNNWWWYVARQYADTVHKYSNGYMKFKDDGIVRGALWYIVYGGRQDYMTYFKRGRECTIELNGTPYILNENKLSTYWFYNVRSLINYMRKALYGLSGTVTSSQTRAPIKAKITLNHDTDSSEVYSDSIFGKYYRLLSAGNYTVTASAPGYDSKTFNNIIVTNDNLTTLDIQLTAHPLPVKLAYFTSSVSGRDVKLNWVTEMEENNERFEIQKAVVSSKESVDWEKVGFVKRKGNSKEAVSYSFEDRNLQTGKYKYRLKQIDYNGNFEFFELAGDANVGLPAKFDLSQNYPNPFNPITKINFDLPESGLVTLKVYDVLGKEVATIVNEIKEAGYYTLSFDAEKFSSGIYFYRLSSNGFVSVKRMVVLK